MSADLQRYEQPVWHSFDTRSILPPNGLEEIVRIASSVAVAHELVPKSVTSREADLTPISISTLNGEAVDQELPWIRLLYLGAFRKLVQRVTPEPIVTAQDQRSSIVINVQRFSDERGYESHVDSQPVSTMLYATSHPEGAGGELVVSNRGDVKGRKNVDADALRIYPTAGQLVVFDGRQHTHYVAPLNDPEGVRATV
ncbi:MAG TPA: 2OG-Fe(II) oxygenase, partial [Candidatus Dormibacteraeota bacterium]|nr:2OG-Fe(II) oxygenase [Candidatus Dormibacteraeota bacterium]